MNPREPASAYAARQADFYASRETGRRCCWFMDRGYGKGRPCGNTDKLLRHGAEHFCPVHFGIAQDPKRLAKQPAFLATCREHTAARLADLVAAEASEREPRDDYERVAVARVCAHPWPSSTERPRAEEVRVVDRPARFVWYGYADPETGEVGNCQLGPDGWLYPPRGETPVVLAWVRRAA